MLPRGGGRELVGAMRPVIWKITEQPGQASEDPAEAIRTQVDVR